MSSVPVAVLGATQERTWESCQRCGLARSGLQEVERESPSTGEMLRLRWCGQCRGEPAVQPSTDDPSKVERCPSCDLDKPLVGWANNWVGPARVALVCGDCAPPRPADRTDGFPRFRVELDLNPAMRRILAGELVEVAGSVGHPVLTALVDQLRQADGDPGPVVLEVDVAGMGLADRSRLALALEAAIQVRHPVLHSVRRAWVDWLRPQLPTGRVGG